VYAGEAIPVASWKQVLRTMSSQVQASTRDALLFLLLERGDADAADLAGTLNLSVQRFDDS
jgi:predicted ArsR family transcriptional regulator